MELLDIMQEEAHVDEKRREGLPFRYIYRNLRERATEASILRRTHEQTRNTLKDRLPSLEYVQLTPSGWSEGSRLCGETDIDASDCIHLATAKLTGCHLLVTKDTPLRNLVDQQLHDYILAIDPSQVNDQTIKDGKRLALQSAPDSNEQ